MQKIIPLLFLLLMSVSIRARQITPLDSLEKKVRTSKDSVEIAQALSHLGNTWFYKGDFVKATEYFFRSLQLAERIGAKSIIASNYNNLAAVYMETENYEPAEQYAQKAIDANKKLNDTIGLANSYNSLANVYYMQEKDSLSLLNFHLSLKQREAARDSIGLFKGNKNLGAVYFEMGDTATGIKYTEECIRYLPAKTDSANWFGAYLSLAQIYERINDQHRAGIYFAKAAPYAKASREYNKLEDYYYSLSYFNAGAGDFKKAWENHKLYTSYRDSVVNQQKNYQLSELNTKYETEKQQKLIQSQEFELKQKKSWIIGGMVFILISTLLAFMYYRNKRYKMQEKLIAEIHKGEKLATAALFEGEQNERIRIARDLHDSVGQMLSLAKMNLSALSRPEEAQSNTLSLIDRAIDEVRVISHNLIPEELSFGIVPALESMADKINSSGSSTAMRTDIDESIRMYPFAKETELSVYRIIQEVVSNMIRHAQASEIYLSLKQENRKIFILVKDNGRGMEPGSIEKSTGIGWKNVKARVDLLNGDLKLDSEKMTGTTIEISIPEK